MANLGYEFGFEELKRLNDYNFGDSTTGIGKYNVRRSDVTYDDDTRPVITETGEKLLDFENRFEENLIRKEQLLKEEQITNEQKSDNNNNDDSSDSTEIEYSDPLRKIGGGRVLQYPIDLDTDLQDHFEIQVFKYRPAGTLPAITSTNQGSNAAGTKQLRGGYYSGSNRRGNRQNFRLQDLQSTIQLPIPPSIKDTNTVSFNDSRMSGFSAAIMGPAVAGFLGKNSKFEFPKPEPGLQGIRTRASNLLKGTGEALLNILGAGAEAVTNDEFTRLTQLNAIAQAVSALGVSIDVDQAITRVSGAVRNPNLELLFNGPSLRNFSFTIRLTPRSPEESKRVRMIIRVLKQHSAVKRNAGVFNDSANSNFLIGTPDVFKLRYIKAKTQKDIKGLNKFKTCALTSVSVDYTGEVGRFAAYEEDSQPMTTIISLAFTELTPIYDEDYAEFTSDDDVGL
tara:strand:+ start:379 stop:1734 length:1356 start_codon:yes stop_codon:yes gene_type:complete